MQWDADTESIFEQVKEAMANATLLYHHTKDAEVAHITNSSKFSMGRVLQEVHPCRSKTTWFFTCKLSPVQWNYSMYHRELLAACSAI